MLRALPAWASTARRYGISRECCNHMLQPHGSTPGTAPQGSDRPKGLEQKQQKSWHRHGYFGLTQVWRRMKLLCKISWCYVQHLFSIDGLCEFCVIQHKVGGNEKHRAWNQKAAVQGNDNCTSARWDPVWNAARRSLGTGSGSGQDLIRLLDTVCLPVLPLSLELLTYSV